MKKNARYRLLGGSHILLSQTELLTDITSSFFRLDESGALYDKLCSPKSNPPVTTTSLTAGNRAALFDAAILGSPFCQESSTQCDSSTLLEGCQAESNGPNTLDDCTDGSVTTSFSVDESVKKIVVESLSGGKLRGGEQVKIQATVVALSKQDRIDFFYTENAESPDWKAITSVAPAVGKQVVVLEYIQSTEITYTLPKCALGRGCRQAVRVVLRSSRNLSNPTGTTYLRLDYNYLPKKDCLGEIYDDIDGKKMTSCF